MYVRQTKTESGLVRGFPGTNARITVYKGIPFAAPPVGENRWRAPQPPLPWEGVRDCFEFGPINMQRTPGRDPDAFYSKEWHVDPEVPMSEDSLTLNIWTPAHTIHDNLPVYVWIFGGGLQEGYSYEMEFDGERMASRGVIVVSIAYRLNIFGFLAHPDLTREQPDTPTNFGFLDQKAGIEWVRRNIANFGGDPNNVTIGGQSAGGVSVSTHLSSPQMKGLFEKAIIQSAACGAVRTKFPHSFFSEPMPLAEAEKVGEKFLKETLGVETIEEARKLDAFFIRDKAAESGLFFSSSIDGKFVTTDVDGYVFRNLTHDVPVMVGYTADELNLEARGESEAEIEAYAKENYGDLAPEMLKFWKASGKPFPGATLINGNEISTRILADMFSKQGKKVWAYAFNPAIPGDNAGSFHSSDLWFTFETLAKCWRPFDGHHFDLARQMCNYWTNFIKTGDPNGKDADGTPMPKWEAYTPESRRVLEFFDTVGMEEKTDPKMDLVVEANIKAYEEQFK